MTKGWSKKAQKKRLKRDHLAARSTGTLAKRGKRGWTKGNRGHDAPGATGAAPATTNVPDKKVLARAETTTSKVPGLDVRRAIDVKPVKVRWLWEPWFSRGKVAIIAGEPGLGKSQIAISMAATVSTGGSWPCDTGSSKAGDVVMVSVEDDMADTIRPRLDAVGADLKRVHLIDYVDDEMGGKRPFSIVADLPLLKDFLQKLKKPRLVVIDPLNACIAPNHGQAFNPNTVTDVRALMGRLEQLAVERCVAIVCITHHTKSRGSSPLTKITGSFAWGAAVRSAFTVLRDEDDSDRRIFTPAKNNLGNDAVGLAFRIQPKTTASGIPSSIVSWEPYVPVSTPVVRSDLDEAVDFVTLAIAGRKEVRVEELFKLGTDHGFTKKMVRKAAARLGYGSKKKGWGRTGYWLFVNPNPNPADPVSDGDVKKDEELGDAPDNAADIDDKEGWN